MDQEDKIEILEEAQRLLFKCIEQLEIAVGDDPNAVAYLIAPLKIAASKESGYMSRDLNIDKLIARLRANETCIECGGEFVPEDEIEKGTRGFVCHDCWDPNCDE